MLFLIGRSCFLLILILLANSAYAASFDCSKAGTTIEKMICSDADLSRLDEELTNAYSQALKRTPDKSSFKQQQLEWLRERGQCSDDQCVKHKYVRRINTLKTIFGCAEKNIILQLPKALQEQVPLNYGIESIIKGSLADHVQVVVAVADPIWSFTYCDGDTPEFDTEERALFIWKKNNEGQNLIGSSGKILYSITTIGMARIAITINDGRILLEQSSSSLPRYHMYDNYLFAYDANANHIRLIHYESGIGGGESGFNGKVDYAKGEGVINEYEAEESKHSRTYKVTTDPIYIESIINQYGSPASLMNMPLQ